MTNKSSHNDSCGDANRQCFDKHIKENVTDESCTLSPMRLSFYLLRKLAFRDEMDNKQDISHQKALCNI